MSMLSQLLSLHPSTVGAAPKRQKPEKVGFCVRHKGTGKLRFNRWSLAGEPIFNNYCEDCHRAYMAEYRKQHFVGRIRVSRPAGRTK